MLYNLWRYSLVLPCNSQPYRSQLAAEPKSFTQWCVALSVPRIRGVNLHSDFWDPFCTDSSQHLISQILTISAAWKLYSLTGLHSTLFHLLYYGRTMPTAENWGNCGVNIIFSLLSRTAELLKLQSHAACSLPKYSYLYVFCSSLKLIAVGRQARYQHSCHCGTRKSLSTSSKTILKKNIDHL